MYPHDWNAFGATEFWQILFVPLLLGAWFLLGKIFNLIIDTYATMRGK